VSNVEVSYMHEDQRTPFVLDDVRGAEFINVNGQRAANVPVFVLQNVADFSAMQCPGVPDARLERVTQKKL
jgi:hypothetical protein